MLTNKYEDIKLVSASSRDPRISDRDAYVWKNGIVELPEAGIHKVEFISLLNPVTAKRSPEKIEQVFTLDTNALVDAEQQPGFIYYSADTVTLGAARSFCLWGSALEAEVASRRKPHEAAVTFTVEEGLDVYAFFELNKSLMTMTESGLHIARLATMTVVNGEFVPWDDRLEAINSVWPDLSQAA